MTVPRTGNVVTSTLLHNPNVTFKNATDGSVWGYSTSTYTTGDGTRWVEGSNFSSVREKSMKPSRAERTTPGSPKHRK